MIFDAIADEYSVLQVRSALAGTVGVRPKEAVVANRTCRWYNVSCKRALVQAAVQPLGRT